MASRSDRPVRSLGAHHHSECGYRLFVASSGTVNWHVTGSPTQAYDYRTARRLDTAQRQGHRRLTTKPVWSHSCQCREHADMISKEDDLTVADALTC